MPLICKVRYTAASVPSVITAQPCVNTAAVSRHRHHMLSPRNSLQSHQTGNHRLHTFPFPFLQAVTADSSQGWSTSVGQPSVVVCHIGIEVRIRSDKQTSHNSWSPNYIYGFYYPYFRHKVKNYRKKKDTWDLINKRPLNRDSYRSHFEIPSVFHEGNLKWHLNLPSFPNGKTFHLRS